ncbi:type I secretion protein, partial [Acinetobacter oleivorans]
TNDTSLTINGSLAGTLAAGEVAQISVDGGVTWIDLTVTAGNWSYVDSRSLTDGNYTYDVRVVDTAGNVGSTDSQVVTVDSTAPSATTVIAIDSISDDSGLSATDFITNDTTLTVSGTLTTALAADEKVQVSNDGGVTWVNATVTGTSWNLVDGVTHNSSFTYQARVIDTAGNVGSTASQAVTIDTSVSSTVISISAISTDTGTSATDFITNDTTLTVSGTLTTALAADEKVQVSNDGGVTWVNATVTGTSWNLVDGVTHNSSFTYQARVIDTAGNVGSTASQAVTIDTSVPTQTVSINSYTDDVGVLVGNFGSGTTTDDRTPVLNGILNVALGSDEQIGIYQVNSTTTTFLGYASTAGTSWTYQVNSGLNDGQSYAYFARVIDTAGNLGPQSNNMVINVDLTVNINAQNTLDTTPIISGSTGFKIGTGEYLEVTVNGKTYSSQTGEVVVDPLNNTWYVQIPNANALTIGTYNVSAVLKNTSGTIAQDDTTNELVVAPTPVVTVGAGGGDPDQKATAVTIGQDGGWRIHTNQTMLDANGTSSSTLGNFASTTLVSNNGGTGYDTQNYVQNATFIDYNRDGFMDLFAIDNRFDDGQQMFYYNGTTYTAYQVGAFTNAPQTGNFAGDANTDGSANTWSWYGGIMAIDKNGDGLVDMINGDQTPNDSAIRDGYGSQIVLNNDGTITGMSKDGNFATDYAADATHQPIGRDQSQADMELSGVDINNDGIIDFAMHSQNIVADGSRITATGAISTNQSRLVIAKGTNTDAWNVDQIVENVFQRGTDDDPNIGNGVAMTWADFNGDGFMDLFLGRGSESDIAASGVGNTAGEYASRIYYNDGTGKLSFVDPDSNGIGNPNSLTGKYVFTDNVAGGASLALDWNHDGKMDVIELPGMGTNGGVTAAGNTGPINLYTNTTTTIAGITTNSFTTTNLLTQIGKTTIGTSSSTAPNSGPVTGAIAIDVDWDGDRDLLAFTVNGQTTYIENKNNVAYGTSIHLRILDEEGINSLYGNTVQLIDQATGAVVSTQIINAQSGNQTNDSTGIVDFYNLDSSKTYSAVILREKNNAAADVGGVASVGSNTVEILNAAWAGLKATEANNAYVLTTESASNIANANKANGIVGTGYNDTFFATQGIDIYNGAGGTTTISEVKSWSNTGGLDIVDYKLAGGSALTVNLSLTGAQTTGFGTVTFINIEGIAGGSGNDVFTGNSQNNYFEGRGGNDIFNLATGGQDTLMYKLLQVADATGGNGSDTVNGFKVGTIEATPDADIIDIKDLLVGYTADANGAAHYINGVATLDAGETIGNFINVIQVGGNTVISIDRDGTVGGTSYTTLVTLNNVQTDLETLLANHQIKIG